MSEQAQSKRICPYLGFSNDPASRFSQPDSAHRCFAAGLETTIPLEHQDAFCLSRRYPTCPRFVEPPGEDDATGSALTGAAPALTKKISLWQAVLLGALGLLLGLAVILGLFFASRQFGEPETAPPVVQQETQTPVSSPRITAESAVTPEPVTSTPVPVAAASTSTPIASDPNNEIIELSPSQSAIGWVTDVEERGNHFGDSYLYAGFFDNQVYNSAFLIDLSEIPRGASIESAVLQMTGLRDDRLAINRDQSDAAGAWTVRMLNNEVGQDWRRQSFQSIFNAPVVQTLSPILGSRDLAVEQTNTFELTGDQRRILEERIVNNEVPTIAFRVEGPLVGPDNLFAWDTGYGPRSAGNNVTLLLEVGPPPATPPAFDFVLVTSTPTPENIITAAALAAQSTVEATRVGTPTPLPPNAVTPTPYPEYLVLVPTPAPDNEATAEARDAIATAIALTTGTATPIPPDAVTATPTPTETSTPIPTPATYILITSTPTPDTVFAAATLSIEATARATRWGTLTPLPYNWVTPVVVTETPTPLNEATAQFAAAEAAAMAITTGTPTSTPANIVVATPTPVYEPLPLILSPTPVTPTPSTPLSMPPALMGKILFLSDRETGEDDNNNTDESYVYVYDPETGELGRLTAAWPYEMAQERDQYSADTVFRAYVKQLLWTNILEETIQVIGGTPEVTDRRYTPTEEFAIHIYDYKYKQEDIATRMGAGIVYEPAWSPVSDEIAFVSTESQNDEIWVVNRDGSKIRQLTKNSWEWDKSPSWSPDGQQIVFMSNRTGNQQLWIMNTDGSDQKLLMGWDSWTPYNDWAPVWVKYLDPAPPEEQRR